MAMSYLSSSRFTVKNIFASFSESLILHGLFLESSILRTLLVFRTHRVHKVVNIYGAVGLFDPMEIVSGIIEVERLNCFLFTKRIELFLIPTPN